MIWDKGWDMDKLWGFPVVTVDDSSIQKDTIRFVNPGERVHLNVAWRDGKLHVTLPATPEGRYVFEVLRVIAEEPD